MHSLHVHPISSRRVRRMMLTRCLELAPATSKHVRVLVNAIFADTNLKKVKIASAVSLFTSVTWKRGSSGTESAPAFRLTRAFLKMTFATFTTQLTTLTHTSTDQRRSQHHPIPTRALSQDVRTKSAHQVLPTGLRPLQARAATRSQADRTQAADSPSDGALQHAMYVLRRIHLQRSKVQLAEGDH